MIQKNNSTYYKSKNYNVFNKIRWIPANLILKYTVIRKRKLNSYA